MDIYSKFDFHIYSVASSHTKTGDQKIVSESKIENLPILISKLTENDINIISITDHNIFDKDLYLELKKQENLNNCINKVLPGLELDLDVAGKNVHVICVFDDTVESHADMIVSGFETKEKYTVDDIGALLRKIGLGVVIIAHQKCDYLLSPPQKNSLSNVGVDKFYKFIGSEFFDALEIQNTKVEGILKSRFIDDNLEDSINLIVGSDCHEWNAYPSHHSGTAPIILQYMKSLPTFQGLVMAVTDYSRIFNNIDPIKEKALKKIDIQVGDETREILLSDNINVIIGDNSVGKSTLIKYLCNEAEKGAIDFLHNHGVKIITAPINKTNFTFSSQGKIREMFESSEEKLPIQQVFKDYFKIIDKTKYIQLIKSIFGYYLNLWDRNEKINNNLLQLTRVINIPIFSSNDRHYFVNAVLFTYFETMLS